MEDNPRTDARQLFIIKITKFLNKASPPPRNPGKKLMFTVSFVAFGNIQFSERKQAKRDDIN